MIERKPAVRSMWSGAITFGVVSAPVKLYSATEDARPALKMLCREHQAPIHFKRWCEVGDHEVEQTGIAKGAEIGDGAFRVIEVEHEQSNKQLAISEFVPAASVPLTLYQRTYYLAPDKHGRKPYDLLQQAMERTGRVGVLHLRIRDKEQLAILRPDGGRLVVTVLYWPEEIRTADALPNFDGASQVSEAEVKLAGQLVEAMSLESFDEGRHESQQAASLRAQIEGLQPPVAAPQAPKVLDLMESLKASVEAAKTTHSRRKSA